MNSGDAGSATPPRLPIGLWLWFPPLLLIVIIPLRALDPAAYTRWVDGELGLIELATPLLAVFGAVFGIAVLKKAARLPNRAIRVWLLLTTLACVYIAGEELSWGQHLFGWQTPAYLQTVNDQKETNLHNVSSWFDQKPRLLLEIWVLLGGIVVPLRRLSGRGQSFRRDTYGYWFWPTVECLPTAILAILIRLPERAKSLLDIQTLPLEIRFSEPQEYYFAMFLMIYLASINRRLQG